jgi:hypothetical protein
VQELGVVSYSESDRLKGSLSGVEESVDLSGRRDVVRIDSEKASSTTRRYSD